MRLLIPGLYVPLDSPIHRLDPRVKAGSALVLMSLPFAASSPAGSLLLSALVIAIALLSAAPLSALLRTVRAVFWLGFFMFFFHAFSTPGDPLIAWHGLTVTWEGLLAGAVQIFRLCLLVIVSSLLTFTTSPAQLTHGLETTLRPLARLGLPIPELAMVLTIALRFVPVLFTQVDKIAKAQQARGANMRSARPWQRVKSWVPTFVPIFVAAFRRADDLATAMEARGFRSAGERTHLRKLQLTPKDSVASLVMLVSALCVILCDQLT